ncbi:MAG: 4Fe-4S dicluster domain-containing protein, partial [Verrucomicrobiae bacterium]|nr:4Fe-4S dicluster domain-containing protein [Verrucomicrobiae bacterium]
MKYIPFQDIPAEPLRQTFVNIPPWAQTVTYVAGAAAVGVFAYGVWRHVQKWRLGKAEKVDWAWGERLKALLMYAIAQMRVASDAYAGAMHLAIFWGMVVLAMATAIATVDWDVTYLLMGFQFLKGNFYLIYELMADLFGIALIGGLAMGLYRRYVMKPKKLETPYPPTFGFDSAYLLLILLGVAVTGFLAEAARLAAQKLPWGAWSFGGYVLAQMIQGVSQDGLVKLHHLFWTLHAVLALGFIAAIPWSKAFHMVSSSVSIFLRKLTPAGALAAGEGVATVTDLTWRQLAQVDGCTWCGRCQEACPANLSGQALSPKNIVLKLNGEMLRAAKPNGKIGADRKLHGDVIAANELWACTTCMACEQVCPVFIEQPRAIID